MNLHDFGLKGNTDAFFNPARTHRYWLQRIWKPGNMIAFIGLNPSTADEVANDPTVSRCINYAKQWGFGGMFMLNIFAYRSTNPKNLKIVSDPIGPDNDKWLLEKSAFCETVVACWGVHGAYLDRGNEVKNLIKGLKCFGTTKDGHPKHPLYLKKSAILINYQGFA